MNLDTLVKNGETQPVLDCSASLFEKVYVETPLDTDGDGQRDLLAVYIRRPAETLAGLKVPVIYVANPYMMECNEDWYQLCAVDRELGGAPGATATATAAGDAAGSQTVAAELPAPRISQGVADRADTEEIPLDCISDWYHYFLSRGYGLVFCAGLGTKGSDGFNNAGSPEEITAFKTVIDWLGGRARAFTNRADNIEIPAYWSTGKVAMSGKSYLGTMCIALATTGVEGLETIIPEAAIADWYRYFRQNGLPVACEGWQGDDIHLLTRYCFSRRLDPADYQSVEKAYLEHLARIEARADREQGDRNEFWQERNYLSRVDQIKASVYLVHGLNDWNVKPDQFALFWQELKRCGVVSKLLLHQGDHIYIHGQESIDFTGIMHRWLDYWLYGCENGVLAEVPEVLVQSNLEQSKWQASESWPPTEMKPVTLQPKPCRMRFADDLSAASFDRQQNNLAQWQTAMFGTLPEEKPYRAAVSLLVAEQEQRLSGETIVRCSLTLSRPQGIFSAALVDLGTRRRLSTATEVVEKDGLKLGINGRQTDVVRFANEVEPSTYKVITRGWLDVRNRNNCERKEKLEPDLVYDIELKLIPQDYTLAAGHQLWLVLYGTDAEFTLRPLTVTNIEVAPGSLTVELPLV